MLQIREEQEGCFSRVFKVFAEASAILLLYIKVSVSQGLMVAVLISEFLTRSLSLLFKLHLEIMVFEYFQSGEIYTRMVCSSQAFMENSSREHVQRDLCRQDCEEV